MINKREFWLSVVLAAVLACVVGYFVGNKAANKENAKNTLLNPTEKNRNIADNPTETNNKNKPVETAANGNVPNYVIEVYDYVIKNNKAPDGYVGGRRFENRERKLPTGENYQEWDVKPKVQGQNRGAERLVTSTQGAAYYTNDHYRTFTKFK